MKNHSTQPPGRNAPCYCGSNKKYKHCHGAATTSITEPTYLRIRRLDAQSADHLLKFAREQFGEEYLEEAWEEYRYDERATLDLEGPEGDPFTRWALFNYKPDDVESLASMYLLATKLRLDSDLKHFIEQTTNAPYSFYQVLSVQPDRSLRVRDILRRVEYDVEERSASKILSPGHIIYGRIVEFEMMYFFMGVNSEIIMPAYLNEVLSLRKYLPSEPSPQEALSSTTLLEHEENLRDSYFEICEIQRTPPTMVNSDGDPLQFCLLSYEIPSLEIAFEALKDLELKVMPRDGEELFQDAKRDRAGNPKEITLHWLRKGHKHGIGDNTTLAMLKITDRKLSVEVNSERRSKRIQKEIRKRLGDQALLLRTETRSPESMMREVQKSDARQELEETKALNELPEVQNLLKEFYQKHWNNWFDERVPALRGMTPREAAEDVEGRELLKSLLMDFDLRNEKSKGDIERIDTDWLRHELGL